jgi:integrase
MPSRVPVVLTPSEVRRVIDALAGVPRIAVMLLYGAGLRLHECLELRVKDVDFERREIAVRRGKGQKDRRVMLPETVRSLLVSHLEVVRRQHTADLARGLGRVPVPDALDRSSPTRQSTGRGSSCFRPGGSTGRIAMASTPECHFGSRRRVRQVREGANSGGSRS